MIAYVECSMNRFIECEREDRCFRDVDPKELETQARLSEYHHIFLLEAKLGVRSNHIL
jgi:hypothetical protein